MLNLTENATTAISAICEERNTGNSGGIRIATREQDGQQSLALSTATRPLEGDSVVEEHGARVFLEPEAAAALDDKTLDAQFDPDGRVQFLIAPG